MSPSKLEILAYEVTALVHGQEAATKSYQTAVSRFGCADPDLKIETSSAICKINLQKTEEDLPTLKISPAELNSGITLVDLFTRTGLAKSKGQTRRLIEQGGAYLNEQRIEQDRPLTREDFKEDKILLRAGKKRYHQILLTP